MKGKSQYGEIKRASKLLLLLAQGGEEREHFHPTPGKRLYASKLGGLSPEDSCSFLPKCVT
jgi:hypothetical protein